METNIKKKEPAVDIIMPNYNKDLFINEAIDSVIKQEYKNWRLIVIDGNSQDKSKKILTDLEKKFSNIKVIFLNRKKNTAFARNLGIRISRAEFIAFLDSDDYWIENKLSEQISFMEKFNYDFTYTNYIPFIMKDYKKFFKKEINVPNYFTYEKFIYNTSIATSSMIIKRKIISKIKCPNVKILEDYPFKCKILKTKSRAFKLNKNLMCYRISEGSMQSKKLRNLYWLWNINRKYNKLPLLKNILSILMISINSVRKYGIK